jgi:3-oxoacyl-[acyl-carrier-protein] synthase-3
MKTKIKGLQLRGISAVVPNNIVSMRELSSQFGEKEIKRIILSTGIESVHVADRHTNTSDLCAAASNRLFEELNLRPESVDAIVFVSQTPDLRMPATSCLLQARLGLKKDCVAFDINYGCSGYIYALYQAAMLISAGGCQRVLLCVGDTISHFLDPNDHKVRLVFGDAGTASIVEAGNDTWSFDIRTDGHGAKDLMIPKNAAGTDDFLYMNGGAIMNFALSKVKPVVDSVLQMQDWALSQLSSIILHQANYFILNYLGKKLGIDKAKLPIAVKHYGNTGPASIPLTLCDQPAFQWGASVLCGFGVGLSWGACALDLSGSIMLDVVGM